MPAPDPQPEPPAAPRNPNIPYAKADPAELRAAILPEDVERFDTDWARATDQVRESLSLVPMWEFLEGWRRVARLVNHRGHDHWRGVMALADYINTHGKPPPGTKTYTAEESVAMVQQRIRGLGKA